MRRSPLALVTLAVIALIATGCSKPTAEVKVTSAWPRAEAERTVPKPPVPPTWPLTGLPAPSAQSGNKRVVSIKVENSAASRPQTALNEADVVYESVTEGGITRFNAMYQSNDPKVVGPVRSARLSDLWVVPQYGALFFFSGASSTINGRVNASTIENLSEDAGISAPYFRSASRRAPHNLFLDMERARAEAKSRGYPTQKKTKGLAFSRSTDSSQAVSQVVIPMSDIQRTTWTYNPKSKTYTRANNGVKHVDAETGKPVSSTNVVVLWARYKPFSRDKVGSTTYDINLGGTGRAAIFRDGVRIDGSWSAGRDAPPVFKTEDGKLIKLAPGNTWFEIVDQRTNISMR